jgi:predicted GH43/DUF377 family glycosyl hydrolase
MAKERRTGKVYKEGVNVAHLPDTKGGTVLVFRQITKKGELNEPDWSNILLVRLNQSGVKESEEMLWIPSSDELNLEDPRAILYNDNQALIGLTAVIKEGKHYIPYPALSIININDTKRLNQQELRIIKEFGPGKNTTPLTPSEIAFRKEGQENNFKLFVFRYDKETNLVSYCCEIEFPKNLPWASFKIGTTKPPDWIDENTALFLFHGIRKEEGKYIYSIGRALLKRTKDGFFVQVAQDPILTPDNFLKEDGTPIYEELYPHLRKVVYATGGALVEEDGKKKMMLLVNVGDKETVEVSFDLEELLKF